MSHEQTSFLMPLGEGLDPSNRWVKMARLVPWELAERAYGKHFRRDRGGQRPLSARVALGALIIRERLNLTDRETVEQIRENPYLQCFLGYASFSTAVPFDASLMVHFRKRLGAELVTQMNQQLIADRVGGAGATAAPDQDDEADGDGASGGSPTAPGDETGGTESASAPTSGTLIIDATCAPADITYPTDLKVIEQAREATERIMDDLHAPHVGSRRRPRTHRHRARRIFVAASKSKKLNQRSRRVIAGRLLRFLRRNLQILAREVQAGRWDLRLLAAGWYKKLLVAAEIYRQQLSLYRSGERSIPDRIVNLAQPHIRPIVRGKAGVPVEFGAKISASSINGWASLDHLRWDAYYEGNDLPAQAESFRARTGHYPSVIHADKAYTTRANRAWCSQRGIRLAGIGPGRPPSDPDAQRARRRQARDDEAARQPIEGIFGRAKRRWSLARIMAKLATTAATIIALVFLVMNLEALLLPTLGLILLATLLLTHQRGLQNTGWLSDAMSPGPIRGVG